MKAKIFTLMLLLCITYLAGCDEKDDGHRAFMANGTIMGDTEHGYYCFMDGGGVAFTRDQNLSNVKRGYFSISYMQQNWSVVDGNMFIDQARITPYTTYDIFNPINKDEADQNNITHKDSCQIAPLFTLGYCYNGYINLSTGISIFNHVDKEKAPIKMNLVYDQAKQMPDSLFFQLCYNPRVPEGWTNTSIDYGTVSFDISSLATLQQWNDSVVIVINTGDDELHHRKISKSDFANPVLPNQ